MDPGFDRQSIVDAEQLRPLPAAYWVLGGTSALMSLYGLFYIGMGVLFATLPFEGIPAGDAPPEGFFLLIFGGMGLAFLLLFGTTATLQLMTGFWIRRRRRRVACLVTAGISCLLVPFGTLIGVMTFLVLLRPSVSELFDAKPPLEAAAGNTIPIPPA